MAKKVRIGKRISKEELESSELNKAQYVKLMTMTMYDVLELRKALGNRIEDFDRRGGALHKAIADELRELSAESLSLLEMEMEARVWDAVCDMPIIQWLEKIHGIGPRYSGSLVAIVLDIERFRTISALWAYFGMHLIPICPKCKKIAYHGSERIRFCMRQATRRWYMYSSSKKYKAELKKGIALDEETFKEEWIAKTDEQLCQHEAGAFKVQMVAPQRKYFKNLLLDHNPFAKSTAWKIAGQYVRQGKFYRYQYELQKARYTERDKGTISDGQLDLRARRAMIKLFLSHMWEMWRKSEGLPAGRTWLMEQRGMDFRTHKYIPPPYADTFDKKKRLVDVDGREAAG